MFCVLISFLRKIHLNIFNTIKLELIYLCNITGGFGFRGFGN